MIACILIKGPGIAPMIVPSEREAWETVRSLIERGFMPTIQNLGPKSAVGRKEAKLETQGATNE